MNQFVTLALLIAGASANYGGYSQHQPEVRVSTSYGHSSYGSSYAPAVREVIPITSFNQDIRGSLSNTLSFTTGNGISISDNTQAINRPSSYSYQDEYGRMVQSDMTVVKSGSMSYTSPEGIPISLSYNADDNGYRAEGSHLPVSPAPVQKLPEVLEAEQEHHRLYAEAAAKAAAAPDNSYSHSYSAPSVSSYSAPAVSSYSAPAPMIRHSYSAPAVSSYSAPAPVVRASSYAAPSVSSYSVPAPVQKLPEVLEAEQEHHRLYAEAAAKAAAAPDNSYTHSYAAPSVSSYAAPAPVVRASSYAAPAVVSIRSGY